MSSDHRDELFWSQLNVLGGLKFVVGEKLK